MQSLDLNDKTNESDLKDPYCSPELPKYESTKGTTNEQQANAIKFLNFQKNIINTVLINKQKEGKELENYEELNTQSLVLNDLESDFEEPFCSSGSEYIPETDSEESEEDKGTKTSWNCEISSLALKNLNERQYQETKLLPLTEDVMKFQNFLNEASKEACAALQGNRQIKLNYRRLSECVLSLTLLLNRKRIGEIQYLKLDRYSQTVPQNQQEEFLSSLSETEKMFSKTFKRIVTEGKGSKPIAILFPTYIQKFIEVLLSVRNQCVDDSNEYLFANPNTKNKHLSEYHTVKKLAQEADVQDTALFTSTRLRNRLQLYYKF
ncbi:unnamed protein product [Brassicogethes aeneus]|uniref:Uncharacterized protein n=1 Tax=Brassicogethes aeneus TaxID=1431903 RepID=A0A9P0BGL1_BRAAE|nr:unnamed protein product [Brassicogethes aeneus]